MFTFGFLPDRKKIPEFVLYLGNYLAPAVFSMLVGTALYMILIRVI